MCDYAGEMRIWYDCGSDFGNAVFVRHCSNCGKFVKPDKTISTQDMFNMPSEAPASIAAAFRYLTVKKALPDNATCKKCGRTKMIFEGFV